MHPHLMKVYKIYQDRINFYIVFEYIDGEDLSEFLKRSKYKFE